ncbi:hypothetical protein ASPBRDRAFT_604903 [Aspergillus brasiliensis CBS 101740]|uniref:Uncharacterized protein n=1 Tax=Aspergillus brasiliensis (strain CBS 101740 / IMI 381727 / IBT 21946) TaxID=767769 RepID=A0A1L9UHM8_ASPBC|nr:hypothetical protein ASPBRDRAFT_604903 [Aspergillus brasiliensis CBS 101740]
MLLSLLTLLFFRYQNYFFFFFFFSFSFLFHSFRIPFFSSPSLPCPPPTLLCLINCFLLDFHSSGYDSPFFSAAVAVYQLITNGHSSRMYLIHYFLRFSIIFPLISEHSNLVLCCCLHNLRVQIPTTEYTGSKSAHRMVSTLCSPYFRTAGPASLSWYSHVSCT